jgi:hypothetical protein
MKRQNKVIHTKHSKTRWGDGCNFVGAWRCLPVSAACCLMLEWLQLPNGWQTISTGDSQRVTCSVTRRTLVERRVEPQRTQSTQRSAYSILQGFSVFLRVVSGLTLHRRRDPACSMNIGISAARAMSIPTNHATRNVTRCLSRIGA